MYRYAEHKHLVEIGELVPVHMDPATLTQNRIYTGGAK